VDVEADDDDDDDGDIEQPSDDTLKTEHDVVDVQQVDSVQGVAGTTDEQNGQEVCLSLRLSVLIARWFVISFCDKLTFEFVGTSDSAYSYSFLRSVVCLSVVCRTRALCLNHSTDLHAIWQVHLQGLVTHCARCGSLTFKGKGRLERLNPGQNCTCLYDSPGGSID